MNEKEEAFTPGPWSAEKRGPIGWIIFQGLTPGRRPSPAFIAETADGTDEQRAANAALIAAAPALYEALEPVKRGANEADYYCPDDVPDDHVVLVRFTIGELRAARAALSAAQQD